jgi:hypothetical protein
MSVRIREVFKITWHRNPISGHEWSEHGPTTSYEIVRDGRVVEKCKTQKKADKLLVEWQNFEKVHEKINS